MRATPFDDVSAALQGILSPSEVLMLPKKWEKLGDILVLKLPDALNGHRSQIAKAYATVLGCRAVLRDVGGITGVLRTPAVEHLWGATDTETTHLENGIRYRLDPRTVMFSSGNMAERIHMRTVARPSETIVDLFAGIGYFTVPLAASHRPARIYACELNPVAFAYLQQNIVLNHVTERVTPLLGDNRIVAPKGVADRVVLGYLEGTATFLPVALDCLHEGRGILHYHEAVPAQVGWHRPMGAIKQAAESVHRKAILQEVRTIKSYAPGVDHIVLDVEVS